MEAQIKLGRIFGVEIGLHYSWFIIALLITFSLAAHFQATNPEWSGPAIWVSAIITGVLFFATLVAHELAHTMVARRRGLPIRSITLFALGGVAQIEKEATDPESEFWMAIAGPLASVVIGGVCLALAWALGWAPMAPQASPPLAVLVWLGYINIWLAIFNMIPGFPLDGGRILRALLWWMTGNGNRATRSAARVGQFVAFSFIFLGFWRFFAGAGFGGLWIAFIGWFLLDAARASYVQVEVMSRLRGLRVGDMMARDCPTVDGHSDLQAFIDEYLLRTGRRCFIVKEDGHIAGLITPHEIKNIERGRWPYTTVEAAMRPLDQLHTLAPETPVSDALEMMQREDVNQLPVVANGHLEGILSRGQILRLLQARAELDA